MYSWSPVVTDAENNVEEVNRVISRCLPMVYDARDIVDIEDQVIVLGDGAGDLYS
jgi:hypothetical protein